METFALVGKLVLAKFWPRGKSDVFSTQCDRGDASADTKHVIKGFVEPRNNTV